MCNSRLFHRAIIQSSYLLLTVNVIWEKNLWVYERGHTWFTNLWINSFSDEFSEEWEANFRMTSKTFKELWN